LSRHFSEDRVASFLVSQKYRILDQNVVFPTGEIDIVALKGRTLVFVEVRYRKNFDAAETVDLRKLERIMQCAYLYTGGEQSYRIDVSLAVPKVAIVQRVRLDGCCESVEWVNLW